MFFIRLPRTIGVFVYFASEKGILKNKLKLIYSEKVVDQIAARCTDVETGAGNIDGIMTGSIMPRMSQEIFSHIGEGAMPAEITLDLAKDGAFNFSFNGG